MEGVLGDLGIGLATTLLGLTLRVVYLQRDQMAESKLTVDQEISELVEGTVFRIRETNTKIEQSHILLLQTFDEHTERAKEYSDKLASQVEQLEQRLTQIQIPSDAISSHLKPALASASQSILEFSSQFNNLTISPDVFAEQVEEALNAARDFVTEVVRELIDDLRRYLQDSSESAGHRVRQAIGTVEQTVKSRIEEIDLPSMEIDQQVQSMLKRLESNASLLAQSFDRMERSITEADKKIQEAPVSISQHIEGLQQKFSHVFSHTEQLLNAVGKRLSVLNTTDVTDSLSGLESFVRESHALLTVQENQAKSLRDLTSHIEQTNELFKSILNELETASESRGRLGIFRFGSRSKRHAERSST
ncbi:MAG: hypothetical protein OXG24_00465 [Gammaproteobacteria bacterium]|nr:hypothetical protein [Gammaproteobacteria bacterium]